MLIATYGPSPENKKEMSDPGIRKPLYDKLSYLLHGEPVWCFYAGDAREFWVNSLLSVPVCPEILTVTDADPRYVYAIDKVMWDAYLNSNGQTPLPELVRASSIPEDELFMYELIAEDIQYGKVYDADMRKVREAFASGLFDGEHEGLSAETIRGIEETTALGRAMYRMIGGKTEEQYINQSVCFFIRNLYLSTIAVDHYDEAIYGSPGDIRMKLTPANYVKDYYDQAYIAYSMEPSEEELRYLHDELCKAVFY